MKDSIEILRNKEKNLKKDLTSYEYLVENLSK